MSNQHNTERSSALRWPNQRRVQQVFTHRVDAPPAEVFVLLCPVREYDWIPYWRCRMLYSESGVAEAGCIFATDFGAEAIWTISRYEPPRAIEFVVVQAGEHVQKLEVSVQARDGGRASELTWRRVYTALGQSSAETVDRLVGPELDAKMDWLGRALDHYCRTGEALPADDHA